MIKTSRRDLIDWINSLNIEISKVEEMGKGTHICQILYLLDPSIPQWIEHPRNQYEYMKNLKIAQAYFAEHKVDVRFPIEKLSECKLQDNLEFCQWLYKYFISYYKGKRVEKTREVKRLDIIENIKRNQIGNIIKLDDECKTMEQENKSLRTLLIQKDKEIDILRRKIGQYADKEIKDVLIGIEEERDFYYNLLVEIEKYVQESNGMDDIKKDILHILYRNKKE